MCITGIVIWTRNTLSETNFLCKYLLSTRNPKYKLPFCTGTFFLPCLFFPYREIPLLSLLQIYTDTHILTETKVKFIRALYLSLSLSWNNPYTLKCLVIAIHWVVSNLILYCMEHVRENSAALGLKESNSHHCLFINLLNLVPL